MKWRTAAILGVLLLVAGVSAGLVFAQLTDTQTASGTVNATSTSADLSICEPDSTAGPACGSDDSGADEIVFETLENILPGEVVEWDIRLRNVGAVDWILGSVILTVTETLDPGLDCPQNALTDGVDPVTGLRSQAGVGSASGVFILGQAGDSLNDNPSGLLASIQLRREGLSDRRNVKVATGDYEDVRLRLQLTTASTENCDDNEWNVSWEFTAGGN